MRGPPFIVLFSDLLTSWSAVHRLPEGPEHPRLHRTEIKILLQHTTPDVETHRNIVLLLSVPTYYVLLSSRGMGRTYKFEFLVLLLQKAPFFSCNEYSMTIIYSSSLVSCRAFHLVPPILHAFRLPCS